MPNQRKPGKRKVGAWVDREIAKEIQQQADSLGLCLSDYVKVILNDHITKEQKHG